MPYYPVAWLEPGAVPLRTVTRPRISLFMLILGNLLLWVCDPYLVIVLSQSDRCYITRFPLTGSKSSTKIDLLVPLVTCCILAGYNVRQRHFHILQALRPAKVGHPFFRHHGRRLSPRNTMANTHAFFSFGGVRYLKPFLTWIWFSPSDIILRVSLATASDILYLFSYTSLHCDYLCTSSMQSLFAIAIAAGNE